MKSNNPLLNELKVINLGLENFYNSFKAQGVPVVNVSWKPPAVKNIDLLNRLLDDEAIEKANNQAVKRLIESRPILVDLKQARDVIPGIEENMILHAGPPVSWERMCGPVRGAVMGALIYEGKAGNAAEAKKLAESGKIKFSPCHHHRSVGPMAGVVSPSMYVYCVKNETYGNTAHCTVNEGLGMVLRFGAYDSEVIKRLKWMEKVFAPLFKKAILKSGGIDIKKLTSQALLMGDECHNRNVAGTSLFLKEILPFLLETGESSSVIKDITDFINSNVHFYLNISMAACKAVSDSILGFKGSTIMSAMARNGTDIGIRIAGLGEKWFTAPSGQPKGLYFSGFSEKDANPDLGDSTISETAGIGGFAMACAPAIVKFIGGKAAEAVDYTMKMYRISHSEHRDYQIPALDFRGAPVGVDIRKVADTGITPIINTGIAHKKPGIGQVGAGILYAPFECFEKALEEFATVYKK